jgi:hypothetical protein
LCLNTSPIVWNNSGLDESRRPSPWSKKNVPVRTTGVAGAFAKAGNAGLGASAVTIAITDNARAVMMLRVRLGEGFQNNTVRVKVDGREVCRRAGVSTDWTISRADAVEVQTEAAAVQLEVAVEDGPQVAQQITPAQTPFVEVRLVNGELLLLPLGEEPPML